MKNRVMTYILVEDDRAECERFKTYTAMHSELLCLGIMDTAKDALERTLGLRPQVVILDLELRDSHGLEYLTQLNKLQLNEMPSIVVLTSITGKATREKVKSMGIESVVVKSERNYMEHGPKYIFDNLMMLQPYFEVKPDAVGLLPESVRAESYEERWQRVEYYCEMHGALVTNRHTAYLVAAVLEVMELERGGFILKRLLVNHGICERFQSNSHTVAEGMRECLTGMWDRGGELNLREEYERVHPVSPDSGMPELKRLLRYIADQLKEKKLPVLRNRVF